MKNFEKRVRQNETIIRRIHEFNKQSRYKDRYKKSFFKKYEKSFSRNKKSKNLSVKRIDKFVKKLIKNKKKIALFELESKKLKLQFLQILRRSYRKNNRLFSDHVDDAMIFTETMTARKKNSEKKNSLKYRRKKNKNDKTMLNDENKKTYETFQKMIHRVNFDFNSSSKNEF